MAYMKEESVANVGNERFNAEAAAWDSNPFVHAMSLEAWKAIQIYLPSLFSQGSAHKLNVLEVGCGTGLLSFAVAPAVHQLVAIDSAEGMIEVLSSKLNAKDAPQNIFPLAILLEDPEDKRLPPADDAHPDGPRRKYDLVISHLVLHHIADLKSVLRTILGCLKEGGVVALTDYEDFGPDARRFHPASKMDGVEHHGIPRDWMATLMKEVGFKDVRVEVAWSHSKLVETYPGEFNDGKPETGQGEMMKFTYLICLGQKA
ncbi:hypothetical protein jhhlp_001847 [Lomentospora prolificans]|uniref:Methyltransferase type 12 domain-containing protein n=1 Tax=Lomentospora prolificans TaxID=41688 RepID=A0A2N3NCH3_9PEZI|nr:hypothetical protein jhhlp_001847 [Lomentospora prolificans]